MNAAITHMLDGVTPHETELTTEPARSRLGSATDHDALTGAAEGQDDQISGSHWIVGGVVGLVCIAPCLALGVHTTHEDEYDNSLWYTCWVPCVMSASNQASART